MRPVRTGDDGVGVRELVPDPALASEKGVLSRSNLALRIRFGCGFGIAFSEAAAIE